MLDKETAHVYNIILSIVLAIVIACVIRNRMDPVRIVDITFQK